MGRHTAEKAKVISKQDKSRQRHMASLELLAPKAIRYIEDSLTAVLPCSYCSTKDGVLQVAKRDENDKCLKCHGTNLLPDHEARKWATEEVAARIVPKPKSVEMELDDKREMEEWAEVADKLPNEKIDELAKMLGMTFSDDSTAG